MALLLTPFYVAANKEHYNKKKTNYFQMRKFSIPSAIGLKFSFKLANIFSRSYEKNKTAPFSFTVYNDDIP